MTILDGRKVSSEIKLQIIEEINILKKKIERVPGLSVVIVGENKASKVYVKSKDKMASELGIKSNVIEFDENISSVELIKKIKELNGNGEVNGVLVQLPLPKKFSTWEVLSNINPDKDVDCFLPTNLGMILLNRATIFPCTPSGILKIFDYYNINVSGMNACVVGRSFIVGKPIAAMLTNKNATVTICHSKTKNLAGHLKRADLIVSAIGKPGFISEDMVKQGSILIDVGINYISKKNDVYEYCDELQIKKLEKKGYAITGDIHKDAYKKSLYYTPVPGGVGPMTVTMLMYNTLQLFKKKQGLLK